LVVEVELVEPVVDPVEVVDPVVVDPVEVVEPVSVSITVTVTSSLEVNAPSFAIRRKTYTPLTGKVTAVSADSGDAKLANALPLTVSHSSCNELFGSPSSVAVPLSWILVPTEVVLSRPAFTTGAVFVVVVVVPVVGVVVGANERFSVMMISSIPAATASNTKCPFCA
jgi:hypothetical protein